MIEDVMDTQHEPNNWGTMEVTRFRRADGALAEKIVAYGKKNIEGYQAWLDRQLGSRPWFNCLIVIVCVFWGASPSTEIVFCCINTGIFAPPPTGASSVNSFAPGT